jgi:hypothetical protein
LDIGAGSFREEQADPPDPLVDDSAWDLECCWAVTRADSETGPAATEIPLPLEERYSWSSTLYVDEGSVWVLFEERRSTSCPPVCPPASPPVPERSG